MIWHCSILVVVGCTGEGLVTCNESVSCVICGTGVLGLCGACHLGYDYKMHANREAVINGLIVLESRQECDVKAVCRVFLDLKNTHTETHTHTHTPHTHTHTHTHTH